LDSPKVFWKSGLISEMENSVPKKETIEDTITEVIERLDPGWRHTTKVVLHQKGKEPLTIFGLNGLIYTYQPPPKKKRRRQ